MDNRTNTIAGWVLAGGIAALGLSIVSGKMFHAERPEKMGYPIEGVETEGEGGTATLTETDTATDTSDDVEADESSETTTVEAAPAPQRTWRRARPCSRNAPRATR